MTALAVALLFGCSAPAPRASRPPVEPFSSGVTLYVIEAYDDFLDDLWPNPLETPGRAQWMGEQALQIALRAVSRAKTATLARRQRAELREGVPVEFVPDTPVHFFRRGDDGTYRLEMHGEPAGFRLRLKAERFEHKYARIEHELRLVRPEMQKIEGTDLEAGPPELVDNLIERGTLTIPVGGTMAFSVPRAGHRTYLVLAHVASLEPG